MMSTQVSDPLDTAQNNQRSLANPSFLHQAVWPARLPYSLPVPETTLWFNLEVTAQRYPSKAAYFFFGRAFSFQDIKNQAEKIAGWLQSKGVKKGDRVALFMQNCPQFIIAFYGAMRADAVIVPVSPMSKDEELVHYLRDSGAKVVICAADLAEIVQQVETDPGQRAAIEHVLVTHYSDAMPSENEIKDMDRPSASIEAWLRATPQIPAHYDTWPVAINADFVLQDSLAKPDDLAVLPYTSGTTGAPKGCMHTHRTLMANTILGVWSQSTPAVVNLAVVPIFHITGLLATVLAAVYVGSTSVILPRWDRDLAARILANYGITHWTCIPTMVADVLGSADYSAFGFAHLKYISGGGAPMPKALAQRLKDEFGLGFVEGYGLTETVATTHLNPPDKPKAQCIGIPVFGVDSRVIDPETLEELPLGEVGEIVTHGPSVFKGYWQDEAATQAAFIEKDGKFFFRSGDLGYIDEEGYFFLTDRIKRMINASGYKVSPAEVELLLYKHPAIREACVIAAKDDYRGETVKAIVVLRDSHLDTSPAEIIEWAREHMAVYKVPRLIEFRAELPKSGSGKIMWKQLQEEENVKNA